MVGTVNLWMIALPHSLPKPEKRAAVRLIGVAFFIVIVIAPLALKAAFRAGETMAIVFPPWTDRDTALRQVAASDGTFIRNGGLPWIVIARSADPKFPAKLYSAGAWFIGNSLSEAGCAASSESAQT